MRFAVSLLVVAVGAILAFGVTDSSDGVNIQVIGLILILVGLAGLAIARWLFITRRRTDVIYGPNRATWLEPNSPPPSEPWEPVERHVPSLPPDVPSWPAAPIVPAARIVREPQAGRVQSVHGVMDVEPGSDEFLRMQMDDE